MIAVCRALRDATKSDPRGVRVVDADGRKWTNADIVREMAAVSRAVRMSTSEGARVLVQVSSAGQFWAACTGVAVAGRDVVPVATDIPPGVLARLRADIVPSMLIDDGFLAQGSEDQHSDDGVGFGGVILNSSGTTGRSRLVRRSAAAVDHIAKGLVAAHLHEERDQCLSILPLHHAFGFEHAFLGPALGGGCVIHGSEFEPIAVSALLRRATAFVTVPPALRSIIEIGWPQAHVRRVITAGTPLSSTLRARLQAVAPAVELVDLYGATELGTIWLDRGSGGVPVPGVEIAIGELFDEAEGEILVRSQSKPDGFIGCEDPPVDDSGWFRTGDIGRRLADGKFAIVGRAKLIFDVGGLKVNPQDVEAALDEHPGVRASLVAPLRLSDDIVRVAATIERSDTHGSATAPGAVELREFLRGRVANHAIPRSFEFVGCLPRTASGKLIRPAPSSTRALAPTVRRPSGLSDPNVRMNWTRELFDGAAGGYDWASAAGALWSDRWYRRRELVRAGLRVGGAILDVGGGTGRSAAVAQAIVGPEGRVALVDPSGGMAAEARKRGVHEVVIGQAESLPFPDGSFDVVLMAYMLRHVEDMGRAFTEARRVLKPFGRICVLEVSKPPGRVSLSMFRFITGGVLPIVSRLGSGRAASGPMMAYWAQTMEDAADPATITEALGQAGFVGARHHRELGIFSSYRGLKP